MWPSFSPRFLRSSSGSDRYPFHKYYVGTSRAKRASERAIRLSDGTSGAPLDSDQHWKCCVFGWARMLKRKTIRSRLNLPPWHGASLCGLRLHPLFFRIYVPSFRFRRISLPEKGEHSSHLYLYWLRGERATCTFFHSSLFPARSGWMFGSERRARRRSFYSTWMRKGQGKESLLARLCVVCIYVCVPLD